MMAKAKPKFSSLLLHPVLLIWTGIGMSAVLNVWNFSPLVAQCAGFFFFMVWAIIYIPTRDICVGFLSVCMDLFFKRISVRGIFKLEQDPAPMIFVCAPHSNQFLDPILVMKSTTREVGFLCAKKSFSVPMIGTLCAASKAVPVVRPQDLATPIRGTLSSKAGSNAMHGKETKFTEDLKPGVTIYIGQLKLSAKVDEVCSDTVLRLQTPLKKKDDGEEGSPTSSKGCEGVKGKCIPQVDHSEMFEGVFERMKEGGTIGIFPEGGSHDQTQLLPLKAGVSIMALGAIAKYPDLNVKIVPVGLNYFSGHRFRGRVYMDYGDPLEIPREMVERYKQGGDEKKKACADLMDQILAALRSVTVQAPDKETLETFWMLRRLYVPDSVNKKLTLEEKIALSRGFSEGYEQVKDQPKVKELVVKVQEYNQLLKSLQLNDVMVAKQAHRERSACYTLVLLLRHLIAICFYVGAIMPGLFLASPCIILSRVVSNFKARQAVKASSVKIHGKDVVGTWKVLIGMTFIPFLHVVYTSLAGYLFGEQWATTYFFFFPFVTFASILATEELKAKLLALRPLFFTLTNTSKSMQELVNTRIEMQKEVEVQGLIRELGWNDALVKSQSSLNLFSKISPEEQWENWEDSKILRSPNAGAFNSSVRKFSNSIGAGLNNLIQGYASKASSPMSTASSKSSRSSPSSARVNSPSRWSSGSPGGSEHADSAEEEGGITF